MVAFILSKYAGELAFSLFSRVFASPLITAVAPFILVAKHLMAWARRPRRIYSLDAQALRPAEHLIFAARI